MKYSIKIKCLCCGHVFDHKSDVVLTDIELRKLMCPNCNKNVTEK